MHCHAPLAAAVFLFVGSSPGLPGSLGPANYIYQQALRSAIRASSAQAPEHARPIHPRPGIRLRADAFRGMERLKAGSVIPFIPPQTP